MADVSTIANDDQHIAKVLSKTKKRRKMKKEESINGDVLTITTPEESLYGFSLTMYISKEGFTKECQI